MSEHLVTLRPQGQPTASAAAHAPPRGTAPLLLLRQLQRRPPTLREAEKRSPRPKPEAEIGRRRARRDLPRSLPQTPHSPAAPADSLTMARQLLAAVVCSTAAAFAPIVSTVAPLAAARARSRRSPPRPCRRCRTCSSHQTRATSAATLPDVRPRAPRRDHRVPRAAARGRGGASLPRKKKSPQRCAPAGARI